MIPLVGYKHHGIFFEHLVEGHHLRHVVLKGYRVGGVLAFYEFYHIAILILKPEDMLRLFDYWISRRRNAENHGVAHNLEIGGHAGTVRIEDGVALYFE